ncbi:hypothetical protein T11_9422 [Trichinella zimbabwensis]|uniref:Uncharacterized protein n=1 Tax=Trichinella zimbabwensis TaxID=268475 RepID=A0A0V1I4H1_9BILA|nr:hypothetical protein T11_9422 [Trichinella zimbabwensis]
MLTARLTSFRLRNANLTSIFNASIMQTDQVDWSSVGIVCCHLVSLSVAKLVTFRRWEKCDSEKNYRKSSLAILQNKLYCEKS